MTRRTAAIRRGRKERRGRDYDFPTVGALYDHFGNTLPRDRIVVAVRDALSAFVVRDGVTLEETRLQLVRKCELSLRAAAAAGAAESQTAPERP